MEIIRSTPNHLGFFKTLREWMEGQTDRLWICTPFLDKTGVSLLNSAANAQDVKLICRRGKELVDLKQEVMLKMHEDIHVKLYIGDRTAFFGSANLTTNSLMDNIEMLLKFSEIEVIEKLKRYYQVLWL